LKNKEVDMFARLILVFSILCFVSIGGYAVSKKTNKKVVGEKVEYIVKLNKGVDPKRLGEVFVPYQIEKKEQTKNVSARLFRISFKEDPGLKELQRLIKERGSLGIIEPNYKVLITNPMENEKSK